MKTSKKMLALLALNTLAAVSGKAAETKTDRLYKNITKNIQTGKSNSANYKLIESILKEKNKELKDAMKGSKSSLDNRRDVSDKILLANT